MSKRFSEYKTGGIMLNDKTALKKNKEIVARLIDEETVLLPLYKSSDKLDYIYTLNKPASMVWGWIDGKRTISDIKKLIAKEFDATQKEIDKELGTLLKELKEINAVTLKSK
jgi:hypothetical protein